MSRIGQTPISLPPKVEIKLNGSVINVKGPKGSLNFNIPSKIKVSVDSSEIILKREDDEKF